MSNKKDKIKGGLSDKLTPKDISDKFNISLTKIEQQLEMGQKVELEHTSNHALAKEIATDHLVEIPDYYDRLKSMEKKGTKFWKSKEITETSKTLIKRLLRENLGLSVVDEAPHSITFDILSGSKKVGNITIGHAYKNFGKDTMEILGVFFYKDVNHLDIARQTIIKLFEAYPDINRFVMQPKVDSRDFWYKLDGQRIDKNFMYILRGH